jgi:deoxycytidine triphosphate deaminase
MFINPKVAIEKGWIVGAVEEKNIQPNAIDFTLDKLFSIQKTNPFVLSETLKQMRGGEEILADKPNEFNFIDEARYWKLDANTSYDGMSSFYVRVPEGVAAYLLTRSTFIRNGLFLASGLYDSGFEGHIGFSIHNNSGTALVAPGTRIGQIIFVESENALVYAGGYNHAAGDHWTKG